MSKMLWKPLAIALGLLSASVGAAGADADGHEQARSLLQRPQITVKTEGAIAFVRPLSQDGHQQARRLLERALRDAEHAGVKYEGAALVLQPEQTPDPHQQARNLLATPL